MSTHAPDPSSGESPIRMSPILGRPIRQDGLGTIGISTQTLLEDAVAAGHWALAAELATYYVAEIRIMNDVLFTWIADILDYRLSREATSPAAGIGATIVAGFRAFEPGRGDLDLALLALTERRPEDAVAAVELMRVRWAAQHDGLVTWIQSLLTDIADTFGEEAVLESVTLAYEHLWKPRYARWSEMTPEERLQLSVEGMRGGHLSGPRHRGDVGVTDEGDRYVMSLDPCGSCGILRRGDPDSGRPSQRPAGNEVPHAWTWGRTGMSWYSIHSPIALEYLQMIEGRSPLRPLEDCDLPDLPCRWFIYKDPDGARSIDYERMGFRPPVA
ncbi:MAG: hypothetical protein ABWZ82_11570 [Candidatus Limnocylindrales bacterium]